MSFDLADILSEFADAQGYGDGTRAELWRDGWRFIQRTGRAAPRTREQVAAYLAQWKRDHPERLREYARRRRERNPEHVLRLQREAAARYRARHREAVRARDREAARRRYAMKRLDPAFMARRRVEQLARYHARRVATAQAEGRS
jgi:hypothetical protein